MTIQRSRSRGLEKRSRSTHSRRLAFYRFDSLLFAFGSPVILLLNANERRRLEKSRRNRWRSSVHLRVARPGSVERVSQGLPCLLSVEVCEEIWRGASAASGCARVATRRSKLFQTLIVRFPLADCAVFKYLRPIRILSFFYSRPSTIENRILCKGGQGQLGLLQTCAPRVDAMATVFVCCLLASQTSKPSHLFSADFPRRIFENFTAVLDSIRPRAR